VVVGLAAGALVILILVARRSSSPGGGMAPRARVERTADGAWVELKHPSLPAVVTVRHRRRGGDWQQDRARVLGRHFFYTGHAPDEFEVVRVEREDDGDDTMARGVAFGAAHRHDPMPASGHLSSGHSDPAGTWSAY